MNTIIVPVDFSVTSLHASDYAAQLVKGHYGVCMILFHLIEDDADTNASAEKLGNLKNELFEKYPIKIEIVVKQGDDLIDALETEVKIQNADLIVMGITGRSGIAKTFIGSNTLKMAERKVCPVLIVQENAAFREIENVMLASNMQNAYYSTPADPIKNFLSTFKPNLHIVNVNSDHYVAITEAYEKEKAALTDLFKEYNPEFYFIRLFDTEDAINLFAEERNIDLIIAIQREHSLISRIFKPSRTKNLTYHSRVPILVVHE